MKVTQGEEILAWRSHDVLHMRHALQCFTDAAFQPLEGGASSSPSCRAQTCPGVKQCEPPGGNSLRHAQTISLVATDCHLFWIKKPSLDLQKANSLGRKFDALIIPATSRNPM